jgi:hypothetical protein
MGHSVRPEWVVVGEQVVWPSVVDSRREEHQYTCPHAAFR